MGIKNKKLLVTFVCLAMTSLTGMTASSPIQASTNNSEVCKLNQNLKPYDDLKATASKYENNEKAIYVTFENKGNQYVPLYSHDYEYCNSNGLTIDNSYSEYKCPFRNRFIAPGEKIKVLTGIYPYNDRTSLINLINAGQSIKTCYYTTEYTGMEFHNPQIKTISESYRSEHLLYNYVQLFYEPVGKFVHGDNYHLLINFTYDNEEFTVLSSDPNYEINSFGLDFEHAYYVNFHGWEYEDDRYKDYVFDENKVTVNWVKCYTAWSTSDLSAGCRSTLRCYRNPTIVFFSNPFVGISIGFFAIILVIVVVVIVKKNRQKNKAKKVW